jgi:hypothetical protein
MILTVAAYREHATSTLGDDAIQRLLDASEADIVRRAGAADAAVEVADGRGRFITLSRQAASITSITETDRGGTITTLAADDYLLYPSGTVIERLSSGTNYRSHWYSRVTVTYVPMDDEAIRVGVQLDLINLAQNYQPGLTSTTIGSWTEQYAQAARSNRDEFESILARLDIGPSMVVVG